MRVAALNFEAITTIVVFQRDFSLAQYIPKRSLICAPAALGTV